MMPFDAPPEDQRSMIASVYKVYSFGFFLLAVWRSDDGQVSNDADRRPVLHFQSISLIDLV